MKKILLQLLVTGLTLSLTAAVIPGITLSNSFDGLALVTVVFTFTNIFIKPLLKILSLPVEIATLGLFTIIINTVLFLAVDFLLIPLKIDGFYFPGLSSGPVIIAPIFIPAFFTALLGSFLISAMSSIILWLTE